MTTGAAHAPRAPGRRARCRARRAHWSAPGWIVEEGRRPIAQLRSSIADFPEFLFHTLIMRVLIEPPVGDVPARPRSSTSAATTRRRGRPRRGPWRRLALERLNARIGARAARRVPAPRPAALADACRLPARRRRTQPGALPRCAEPRSRSTRCGSALERSRVWREYDDGTLAGLDRLLRGRPDTPPARRRGSGRVMQLVAGHVLEVARTRPWRREARPLRAYGLAHLPPSARGTRPRPDNAALVAPLSAVPPERAVSWLTAFTGCRRCASCVVRRSARGRTAALREDRRQPTDADARRSVASRPSSRAR